MIIKEWEKDSESLLKSRRRRHQQLRGTLKRGAGGGRGGRISKLHQRNVGWRGGGVLCGRRQAFEVDEAPARRPDGRANSAADGQRLSADNRPAVRLT